MIEDLLVAHLRGVRCRSILDVGPGYAEFSRVAARVTGARHITFVDCDRAVLDWQEARCREEGLEARLMPLLLDAASIASLQGPFDLIHCQEVLEHLPDARDALRGLAHLLTSGGRIIITVPTRRSERLLHFLDPAYMRGEPHGHVHEFDETALRALIEDAGLSLEVLLPAQPQFFVAHAWLTLTRMRIEGSTGRILTGGVRGFVYGNIAKYALRLFRATGLTRWARLMPRNYFAVAFRREDPR